ncbi:hypothetical protein [Peptostreptococcus sp. D1]|uniref:hypothetical protein n=1 Tax=Peptostreptococcus sp. D1 TaxID=72304 RepID=UPI0008EDF83C|nr:hypothetical protein [Peptostreptococcus sp. D1]SFE78496.1 hypothetical protein SAMN02910278_01700 [Peptostreptococcus sp. D1]
MITYQVKLRKIGDMTTLPDSQRLFGFLVNNSKKYCSEDDISSFVRDVRVQNQKCMISSLMPLGYCPTPKKFIMQKLEKVLSENQKSIKLSEKKQRKLMNQSKQIVNKIKKDDNNHKNKKRTKVELEKIKNEFNELAIQINNLSVKNIYESIKSMDFVEIDGLKEILKLAERGKVVRVEDLKKIRHIKKTKNFIQKFRLESQIKGVPGIPNIAYSLPILYFIDNMGNIQNEFSFFVRVEEESCISKCLEEIKKNIIVREMPCFLGNKGSSGYNEYRIYNIEKQNNKNFEKSSDNGEVLINLGVLLPNIDNIDVENSILDIHTSDRKPFEIENEIPKVISFISEGSIIKAKEGNENLFKIGKSIDNSKYNPLYNNAIIFGNSYLVELEVK